MGQYKNAFVELMEAFRQDESAYSQDYPVYMDLTEGHSREDIKRYIESQCPGLDYRLYMKPKELGTSVQMHYRVRMGEEQRNRLDVMLRFRFG